MKEIINFWENCNKTFAHIEINNYLENYNKLTNFWQSNFLNKINECFELKNKVVVDYGIGGGHLGIHLKQKYSIKKYIGIDISNRQLFEAKNNLEKNNVEFELFNCPQDFSKLEADFFICQAVIQHFPSINYLDEFLEGVNNSSIPVVMLQIRYGEETKIMDGNYENQEEVRLKCHTNKNYILSKIKKYKCFFEGKIIKNNYQFLIYNLK